MIEREAMFQRRLEDGRVACDLCAHRCVLAEGRAGVCGVRVHEGGRLRTTTWGRLAAAHVDPIEKKPLFHYRPGSASFSIATCGCNLRCDFCQNASLSQVRASGPGDRTPGEETPPEAIVRSARTARCESISYTYSEPTIFYEYARDVGVAARAAGLGNVFVTNGTMNPEVVDDAADAFLDAANVDLKSFSERFYRDHCGGSLGAVRASIARMLERGVWVEVTTLVIPGLNDGDDELGAIAAYLAGLSRDLPWHLSRFHPDHRLLDVGPTPLARLASAREIGRAAGLRHVYVGNARTPGGSDTVCPACGTILIRRSGFDATPVGLAGGRCAACDTVLAGRRLP